MNKPSDKKKQAIVNQKTAQEVAVHAKKKAEIKKINSTVKAVPKKDNVGSVVSKPVIAKPSVSVTQKKPATKPKKHIGDEIKTLPGKRVWPD